MAYEHLNFDLHFGPSTFVPTSERGRRFLNSNGDNASNPLNYTRAIDSGLHVSFESAEVQDLLAADTAIRRSAPRAFAYR